MSPTISVIVPACGDLAVWRPMADRAAASALLAGADQVEVVEAGTLHDARNAGLARAGSEWVVHLDADDFMAPAYIDQARDTIMRAPHVDVHVPQVRYWRCNVAGSVSRPRVWGHTHDCTQECLPSGNYVVVGAPVRTDVIRAVGGWRDWPVYEDWDVWLRLHVSGAVFAPFDGVYEAVARRGSRNRGRAAGTGERVHRQIAAACFAERN